MTPPRTAFLANSATFSSLVRETTAGVLRRSLPAIQRGGQAKLPAIVLPEGVEVCKRARSKGPPLAGRIVGSFDRFLAARMPARGLQ